MEALLTIALSAIVLLAVSGLIGSLFRSYRAERQLQIDLENSQVTLGSLTKIVRPMTLMRDGSTVLPDRDQPETATILYGYEDAGHTCGAVRFNTSTHRMQYGSVPANLTDGFVVDVSEHRAVCDFNSIEFHDLMTSTVMNGSFKLVPSKAMQPDETPPVSGQAGRVTVLFTVQSDATHAADVQTTISLRDYEYIGFKK